MSERFNDLSPAPVDQIMVANREWPSFLAEHPDAINTTVGVLVDPKNNFPWQPASVKQARERALSDVLWAGAFGYQTQAGYPAFLAAAGEQVFGQKTYIQNADELLAYQTLGGTGALSLSKDILSELMRRDSSGRIPMVLDAGWPNHPAIFSEPFSIRQYQHIHPETGAYDHQTALEAFGRAPENAVFLLQTCGYNDDGMDRTPKQWDEVLEIAEAKSATVLLDSAYMGLAAGYENDRYPIVQSVEKGLLTFVSFSASKNMGLYNDRVGALYIANASSNIGKEQSPRLNQLAARSIRRTISNPPLVAAKAAAVALEQPEYTQDLEQVRVGLSTNRRLFGEVLAEERPVIGEGSGLFARILAGGFTPEQQQVLAREGIFALPNSRINLGGLHQDQVERVGVAIIHALRQAS